MERHPDNFATLKGKEGQAKKGEGISDTPRSRPLELIDTLNFRCVGESYYWNSGAENSFW
jgi:hypothetical protein